jgi:hypothetical protein
VRPVDRLADCLVGNSGQFGLYSRLSGMTGVLA